MSTKERDEGRVLRNPRNLPDFEGSFGSYGMSYGHGGLSGPSSSNFTGKWSTSSRQQTSTPFYAQESNNNNAQEDDSPQRIHRSRSPVQRILRTKPNDPKLTSVSDLVSRPYQQPVRKAVARRGKRKEKGGPPGSIRIHIPNCPTRKRTWEKSISNSCVNSNRRTNFCEVDYLDNRKKDLFKTNWYACYYNYGQIVDDSRNAPNTVTWGSMDGGTESSVATSSSLPVVMGKNEQQFIIRCNELGAKYNWFKTKKTVGTELLESYTIEITQPDKKVSFRAIGDPSVAYEAREVGFQCGLRQLDFFFGKKGKEEDGYCNNPSMYSGSGQYSVQGENYDSDLPPLPPFAPPKNPPLPTTKPPATLNITNWWGIPLHSQSSDNPAPPGTCNFTLGKSNEQEGIQSSWSAMCNNAGFFMTPPTELATKPGKPLEEPYRGYFTSPKVPVEPRQTTPFGPKEVAFKKKIESVGLLFACYEMPRDIRDGHEYFSFKIEFWDKKTPHFREKSWGAWMIVARNARESAFDVGLEKLLKIYPDEEDEDINESFQPSETIGVKASDHELSKPILQSQGVGRGRGRSSLTGEETIFTSNTPNEWSWPSGRL